MFKKLAGVLLLFLFINAFNSFSQKIEPSGEFLEDSISIGLSVPYTLSIKYPKDTEIIFPDSLYNFFPFELEEKIYYPTRSDATHSFDSAVFYLSSFEIDSVQYLRLPVFMLLKGDSVEIFARKDSVFLKHVVTEIPDSVATEAMPLKENTVYKRVNFQFNYPYFVIALILILSTLIILSIVYFGKIMKFFKARKMKAAHQGYKSKFGRLLDDANSTNDIEGLLDYWKKYLEKLERRPYLKMTTKEIIEVSDSDDIDVALKQIDASIYGSGNIVSVQDSFKKLQDFTEEKFEFKLKEVRNG